MRRAAVTLTCLLLLAARAPDEWARAADPRLATTIDPSGLPAAKVVTAASYLTAIEAARYLAAFPDIVLIDIRDPDDVRMAGLPDVPTMTELGYPIVTGTWRGIAVPKGTPEDVKAVLGAALEKAVAEKEFVDFMNGRTLGIRFLNAADFKTFVENDVKALDAVVEEVKKQQQQ